MKRPVLAGLAVALFVLVVLSLFGSSGTEVTGDPGPLAPYKALT